MKFNKDSLKNALKVAKEQEKAGGGMVDQRQWKPEVPEKGKTIFKIRPLPIIKTNGTPWVKYFKHSLKGPTGQWVDEFCPNTIGKECPICKYSAELFNTGDPQDGKIARKFWRKKNYVVNILVKKDERNDGANEGKIFIYRFGQKVYDKFDSALFPDEKSGEEELFFIDPVEGYDFNLTCKTQGTGDDAYPNYDDSTFAREKSAVAKTPEEIDKILEEVYDLETEYLSPSKYKSYEALEEILKTKLLESTISDSNKRSEKKSEEKKPEPETKKAEEKKPEPETKKAEEKKPEPEKKAETKPAADDDFLKGLEEELCL